MKFLTLVIFILVGCLFSCKEEVKGPFISKINVAIQVSPYFSPTSKGDVSFYLDGKLFSKQSQVNPNECESCNFESYSGQPRNRSMPPCIELQLLPGKHTLYATMNDTLTSDVITVNLGNNDCQNLKLILHPDTARYAKVLFWTRNTNFNLYSTLTIDSTTISYFEIYQKQPNCTFSNAQIPWLRLGTHKIKYKESWYARSQNFSFDTTFSITISNNACKVICVRN